MFLNGAKQLNRQMWVLSTIRLVFFLERLLLFCADTELRALYHSDYIICDRTFEMAPDSSYQVYTVHGYVNGEALALARALLPNKTQQSYQEMFTALRDEFVNTFGDMGGTPYISDGLRGRRHQRH